MDKIRIGIPRSLFYYYYGYFFKNFLEYLGFEVIESIKTSREIIDKGVDIANDEMCLSLKVFLGHIAYLVDKCDYVLNVRIDNYGKRDQTCTNFLALYDIVNNMFNINIIDININEVEKKTLYYNLKKFGEKFGISRRKIKEAWCFARLKDEKLKKALRINNTNKLYRDGLKLLIVAHPYNLYDEYIGKPIIDYLEKNDILVINCDQMNIKKGKNLSEFYSKNLYWHYNKENIGSIVFSKDYIDGVVFISSFPCGPDSLVNELVIRKLDKPYLNIVVDDLNSLTGIETRLESFIDILGQKVL